MKKVRLGLVGVGGMGSFHCNNIVSGKVPRVELAAICDLDPEKAKKFPNVKFYNDSAKLIRSGDVDAIMIATPHYAHTTIGMDVLKNGLHLLVEKPISVHKADCQRLIAAYKNKKQIFAAMFNQRTDPHYTKVRNLIQSGELGQIRRVNWIITNWFRTEAYYESGGWRATWGGEGGGVLLNQCPHNLDLYQWLFGMPDEVRGYCQIGRYHDIEVEDDVTAYFKYKNGMTGVFITSTGEAPGTNRLEITAERGKIVIENGEISFTRNEIEMNKFSRTTTQGFAVPEKWDIKIPTENSGGQHVEIFNNFADAILDKKPLIAPAVEGIHSVELANAILYSSFTDKAVKMPLSAPAYEKHLKKLIANSKVKKKVAKKVESDLSKSFGK